MKQLNDWNVFLYPENGNKRSVLNSFGIVGQVFNCSTFKDGTKIKTSKPKNIYEKNGKVILVTESNSEYVLLNLSTVCQQQMPHTKQLLLKLFNTRNAQCPTLYSSL